jgi:hypothetical protein
MGDIKGFPEEVTFELKKLNWAEKGEVSKRGTTGWEEAF